jgi:cell division protein FtsL
VKSEPFDGSLLSGRSIDNSRVVREVDPRSSRELVGLLVVVAALVVGAVLYAWPHFQARQTGSRAVELQRERERLIEENRKLRLEKASLEDLRRVERIASERLGLQAPAPERVVVVERPQAPAPGARLARSEQATPAVN